jgi:UDP:flavonoid glycosyltransferase YjiC (YdhE family)
VDDPAERPPPDSGRNDGAHPRRILLGAFGDPGHAFPMIALGRALAARGHEVTLQTWERWRAHVQAEGVRFAAAPEYHVFPNGPEPLDFYEAVVHATRDTLPLVRDLQPDAVVADILTLAPALAAELQDVPVATLIPHVHPHPPAGAPIYSIGARLPRTPLGRAFWQRATRPVEHGLERGRQDLNAVRKRLGLPPLDHVHGGISRQLALVGTFPQLEYPRSAGAGGWRTGPEDGLGDGCAGGWGGSSGDGRGGDWGPNTHVVGPLIWEPPTADVELPPGEDPLVLIAPSTAQDPEHRLLGAALRGLADAPVRVLATWNRRLPSAPLPVPPNARVVEWLSYARTMPHCDVVVCHAGHGTLARALASGCAVVACPVAGDMSENAARLDWAGAGVRLPRRFISPRPLRLAVERALDDPGIRARARELAAWWESNDPADTAAGLVESLAAATHRAPQRLEARGPEDPVRYSFDGREATPRPTRGTLPSGGAWAR